MREKTIEQKLVSAVRRSGGIAFVEVKAPGEKPRPLQLSRHRLLRRLGFSVYVLDGAEQIETILREIGGESG